MKQKRPFVLWVIILAQVLQVVTVVGLFALLIYTEIPIPPQILPDDPLVQINIIISTVLTFFTIIGLIRVKRWGWVLLMLRLGLDLGTTIWAYFFATPNDIGMLAAVVTVFYLNQRSVQQLFMPQKEGTA